jgi:hypothetical protein
MDSYFSSRTHMTAIATRREMGNRLGDPKPPSQEGTVDPNKDSMITKKKKTLASERMPADQRMLAATKEERRSRNKASMTTKQTPMAPMTTQITMTSQNPTTPENL